MATTTTTTTTTRETRSRTGHSKPRILESLGLSKPTTTTKRTTTKKSAAGRPKKATGSSSSKVANGRVTKAKPKGVKGRVARVGQIASGLGEKAEGKVLGKSGKKASGTAKVRGTKKPIANDIKGR